MEKVRYGILGFGGIAENRIAKEGFACDTKRFAPLKYAELIGAFDVNAARQSAAEALNLKWYSSAEAMFADPAIDAIYVATNNLTHAKLAIAALEHNKPVIVEKPLATTVEDAARINQAARERKLPVSVDHMMIHNCLNQEAKALVEKGVLGTVSDGCFHMEFLFGADPAEAASWRCSKIEEMGGPIGDVASHCFYVAEYIFGQKIVALSAVYYPKTLKIVAEDGAYIKFRLEDGREFSSRVAFSENRGGLGGTLGNLGFELYGDKAVLRSYGTLFQLSGYADEPFAIRLELDRFSSQETFFAPENPRNIYQSLIEQHALAVLEGRMIDAADGEHNLHLCAAAHASAANGGQWIEVAK